MNIIFRDDTSAIRCAVESLLDRHAAYEVKVDFLRYIEFHSLHKVGGVKRDKQVTCETKRLWCEGGKS